MQALEETTTDELGLDDLVEEETDFLQRQDEAIFCASCGEEITRTKHTISRDGGFEHSFANPAGILYRIGCFAEAPGVGGVGPESDEFPWFAGYTWQVVICRGCSTHLGWRFWSPEDEFWGLILQQLSTKS